MDKDLDDKKFEVLPEEALINIQVSGHYFKELKTTFTEMLLDGESEEDVAKMLDNLSERRITSLKERRLDVMFLMIVQIERDAKAQGVTEMLTVAEAEERAKR